LSKNNFLSRLSRDSLLAKYQYQYKQNFFPALLKNDTVPPRDKALIRNMLTKPFSLYVFRHRALTEKSQILKEINLRNHAGWTMTSKMPMVYLHYFGNESSKSLLEAHGIEVSHQTQSNVFKSKTCPHCNEPNKPDLRFCSKCRMVLNYDAYSEAIEADKRQKDRLNQIESQLKHLITTLGSMDQLTKNAFAKELFISGMYEKGT
jgi:predicted nucleic acid-binding Zn ribbon protein